ncbi:hypothetical protein BH09MYX1_BH09MYX1_44980 [soil metagenome]
MRFFLSSLVATAVLSSVLALSSNASACGGCLHPPLRPNEVPSLVTDHRMAFSISKTQTILWDQIRYAGDPAEFAWVLPVRTGTEVEVGHDEFLEALDKGTAPTVVPPAVQCFYPQGSQGGGGGFGCGSEDTSAFASARDAGINATFDSGTTVVSQKVVGPYESVILRAADGQAITDWLVTHDFVIPDAVKPVIAYYTTQGFDFVAIRLRPNVGTRAMLPIRIVSPGADGTLPLRMVAAGVGASVGLELFVLSEGRYEATSFENAIIDRKAVTWNGSTGRSNYAELFQGVVTAHPKGVWITEVASKNPVSGILASYAASCTQLSPVARPCASDAGSVDAGSTDGGAADAGELDAGNEAGDASDGGGCVEYVSACDDFDDATRALAGMNRADVTVTRLRANLAVSALVTDLVVGAASSQEPIDAVIQTSEFSDPSFNPCVGGSTTPYSSDQGDGCATSGRSGRSTSVVGIGAVALFAWIRRRARRSAR